MTVDGGAPDELDVWWESWLHAIGRWQRQAPHGSVTSGKAALFHALVWKTSGHEPLATIAPPLHDHRAMAPKSRSILPGSTAAV